MIVNSTQSALLRGCMPSAGLFRNHQHDAIGAEDSIVVLLEAASTLASCSADCHALPGLVVALFHRSVDTVCRLLRVM